MQQADVRIGALDHLAVELEHEAQHAVRGRMLRAEVERVVLDLCHINSPTRFGRRRTGANQAATADPASPVRLVAPP